MKTRMILTLVAMVSVALIAGNASAALTAISLNFRNGSGSLLVTGTAGVVPQSNWNNTDGAQPGDTSANPADIVGSTIVDSTGSTVTGLDIAWAGGTNTYSTNNTGNDDEDLMRDYVDNGASQTYTFTGLPSAYQSTGYDVYVYFGSEATGRTGYIGDGTTTYSYTTYDQGLAFPGAYTQTTDTGSGYPDANYAIFSGLTAASFTITRTFATTGNGTGVHGLQVVQVPEPASAVLLLLGLPLVIGRRRRR